MKAFNWIPQWNMAKKTVGKMKAFNWIRKHDTTMEQVENLTLTHSLTYSIASKLLLLYFSEHSLIHLTTNQSSAHSPTVSLTHSLCRWYLCFLPTISRPGPVWLPDSIHRKGFRMNYSPKCLLPLKYRLLMCSKERFITQTSLFVGNSTISRYILFRWNDQIRSNIGNKFCLPF